MILLFLVGCARTPMAPPVPVEPVPTAAQDALEAEAAARVPDPARGGPPVRPDAAPLPPFTGVDRATAHYVGTQTCTPCHATQAATWTATAHAHARDTLVAHQSGSNPACLRCHATGFGQPGAPTERESVGCEACHGPGSDHVAAPSSGYGELPSDGAACVACHTWDNSPDFTFGAYWPRVKH